MLLLLMVAYMAAHATAQKAGEVINIPAGTKVESYFTMQTLSDDIIAMMHGFTWGGAWRSSKDYQHFEKKP